VATPVVNHPLLATGVATAALGLTLLVVGAPLHDEVAPYGVLSLEFAHDPARVDAIAASWRAAGVLGRAVAVQVLDTLFPFAYGAFGVALARRRGVPAAAALAVVAAFADVAVENPLLDWMLWRGGHPLAVIVASVAVWTKFMALVLAVVLLALGPRRVR
jgi:hypothetical protein